MLPEVVKINIDKVDGKFYYSEVYKDGTFQPVDWMEFDRKRIVAQIQATREFYQAVKECHKIDLLNRYHIIFA